MPRPLSAAFCPCALPKDIRGEVAPSRSRKQMVQAYTLVSATPLTEYSCGRRCDFSYLLGNNQWSLTSSVFAFSQGLPAKAEAPTLQRWPVDAHQLALAPPTRDTSDDYYQAIYLSPRFRRADHKQWARPVNSASSHRQSPKRAPAQQSPCLPLPDELPSLSLSRERSLSESQVCGSLHHRCPSPPPSAGIINRKRLPQSCMLGPVKLKVRADPPPSSAC